MGKSVVEFLEIETQKLVYIAKSNKVKFDELFEQAKEMDKEHYLEIGLLKIELKHTKRLLANCEKALEDRDNKYK